MKTAMQELMQWMEESEFMVNKQFIDKVNECFEKEKEQMINAYVDGFNISAEGWNGEYGIKDFNNIKKEIEAEDYYNKTYNL